MPQKNIGMIVLAVYLILQGLIVIVPLGVNLGIVLALLAIVAGVLILLNR